MKKIIFLLLFAGIIGGVLFFRVELISYAIPPLAKKYNVDISQLNVAEIDASNSVIDELSLNYVNDSSDISMSFSGLEIKTDLNISGREYVTSLHADTMHVVIKEKNSQQINNGESIGSYLNGIPLFQVDVEALEVAYVNAEGVEFNFKGKVALGEQEQAYISGLINISQAPALRVDALIENSTIDVLIEDAEHKDKLIDGSGNFYIENDWLNVNFSGDVGLSQLNRYSSAFGMTTYLIEDNSVAKIDLELDLSRPVDQMLDSLSTRVEFESSAQLSAVEYNLKKANLNIRSTCVFDGNKAVKCNVRQPQNAHVSLLDTPDWLEGVFSNAFTEFVIDVNPASSLSLSMDYSDQLKLDIGGDVKIDFLANRQQLSSSMRFSKISLSHYDRQWQMAAEYSLDMTVNNLAQPLQAKKVIAKSRGELIAEQSMLKIKMHKGERISIADGETDEARVDKVEFHQLRDHELMYFIGSQRLSAEDLHYSMLFNNIYVDEFQIMSDQWDVVIDRISYLNEIQNLSGDIEARGLIISSGELDYSVQEANAKINIADKQIDVSGTASLENSSLPLQYSFMHSIDTNTGQGHASAQSILLANNKFLKQQISQSGYPLQLKSGQMEVDVLSHWNQLGESTSMQVKLGVNNAVGDYAQNQFNGLTAKLLLAKQNGWSLVEPADISVQQVNLGLPVENISVGLKKFEYLDDKQPFIEVSEVSASVLDGSMISQDIEIDLNQPINEFSIFLSALSLEKLLALNQTKDLIASGSFDGELPLQINNGNLLINDGWIKADEEGGFIKYGKVGEVLIGNDNLVMVGELLEDFRYNEMSAQVNLNSDGGLYLTTKLHGRSPKAEINKQVNLNFNIEFNLWKFLESARLLTRIDQDISEQIISNEKE